jgi:hypothetical protein
MWPPTRKPPGDLLASDAGDEAFRDSVRPWCSSWGGRDLLAVSISVVP